MNSDEPAVDGIPAWDTADRMRKAMRQAKLSSQQIADYLGVSRASVSSWINGRGRPSTQTMRLWAIRCGVPYEWLVTGRVTEQYTRPAGPARRLELAA